MNPPAPVIPALSDTIPGPFIPQHARNSGPGARDTLRSVDRRAPIETRPRPGIQSTNAERWSADDDAWRGYRRQGGALILEDRVKRTLDLMLPVPGGALLDVGCATGVVSRLLADRTRVARVVGVDFAPVARDIDAMAVNLDSPARLPYPDASFDVVTCLETLEHVHDTDHLVRELRRVVAPTGYVVVSVPRIDGLLSIAMLAAGMQPPAIECSLQRRYGSPDGGTRVSGHVSNFTRRAFEELLVAQGFRVDAFAQASIYSSWLLATERPAPWKRLVLRAISLVPFKQDVQIARLRPA
jgi:SAM-dependent methyltransferase